MIKKILLIIVLFTALFVVSGCQTVQGLGRDITWTGRAVGDAIDGH
jgi:predicted small secreted protein